MNDCIFCKISNNQEPSWKVYENEQVSAFFDYNPVSAYHTLVIPRKHYQDIFDIPQKDLRELMDAIKKITTIYNQKLGLKNLQIISSSGKEAQQEVFHLHFHIVPRKAGDNQDICWTPNIKIRDEFDDLIKNIR